MASNTLEKEKGEKKGGNSTFKTPHLLWLFL